MKIELNLTPAQLAYLGMRFDSFCEQNKPKFNVLNRRSKATFTIAQDVADKLHTKVRALSRGTPKKSSKITLKYHEAFSVHYFVMSDKDNQTDNYLKTLALNIFIQLDPKL